MWRKPPGQHQSAAQPAPCPASSAAVVVGAKRFNDLFEKTRPMVSGSIATQGQQSTINERRGNIGQRSGRYVTRQPTATCVTRRVRC